MDDVRLSKYLSRILRHAPEDAGLTLEPGGWVSVKALIAGSATKNNRVYTREDLERVVASNDKQRFSFDESGDKIRANQGHSVEIDLQLTPKEPPLELYHGTSTSALNSIMAGGLQKMSRHHVHLSDNPITARKVGSRHGKPVIMVVSARAMHLAGHVFFQSDNGVWLTDAVPAGYIAVDYNLGA